MQDKLEVAYIDMAQLQSFSMFSSTKMPVSSPVKAGGRHTQDLKFLHFNASTGEAIATLFMHGIMTLKFS